MSQIRLQSAAEQVASHLRGELLRRRWRDTVPGIHPLAAELGVNHKTVKSALELLEKEGLLVPQGPGRKRRIDMLRGHSSHVLRIAILAGDAGAKRLDYMMSLQHELVDAGIQAHFASGSLDEFGMDLKKVRKLVENTEADAWIINAGSRDVLEWFSSRSQPAFALFGRRRGLPIPAVGPDKPTATAEMTRRLIELGHRRIVVLCRRSRRLPQPGASEQAFLGELEAHGIETSAYNLPDWEETPEGLHRCLKSLFRITPPTAVIVDEPPFFIGALQFCGSHNIRVPEDVSLVATDPDPSFAWCRPSVAHIGWDSRPWIRRAVRWAANVSRGKPDVRQTVTKSGFVEGGTLGPAKRLPGNKRH
ncbi:hypothetical protein HAHE_23510 [Haloferula helveola]|uniref:HTH gntR-type domain-containing protein n=1 Tax=Haloferula helveola TaxID=490095 RepID=A0ABN6H936_9BACT|nr:hypothetical protein HAHE_23510 [Haloferula helveola]